MSESPNNCFTCKIVESCSQKYKRTVDQCHYQPTEVIWIRRDRATGLELEISKEEAKRILKSRYYDIDAAMNCCAPDMPLTTGFADYWPKEKNNTV